MLPYNRRVNYITLPRPMMAFGTFRWGRTRSLGAGVALCLTVGTFWARPCRAQKSSAARTDPAPHSTVRSDVLKFRARVDELLGGAHPQKGYWGVLVKDRDTGE